MNRTYHQDGTLPGDRAIWVFGSNQAGAHAGGAARVAAERFGAVEGHAFGRTGDAFAIPSADTIGVPRRLSAIRADVLAFMTYAERHHELRFFVTRVGCGIVGFKDADIAPLFKGAPANCDLPDAWRGWVE